MECERGREVNDVCGDGAEYEQTEFAPCPRCGEGMDAEFADKPCTRCTGPKSTIPDPLRDEDILA